MKKKEKILEDVEAMRGIARQAWRLGWVIFAVGGVLLFYLFIFGEPSRVGLMMAAFFLSMSIWILFGSKLIEKRNPLPKDR